MATLVVVRGAVPRPHPLEQEHTVIGRATTCDVVVPITSVVRQHARVTRRGDQFVLQDLDSRGGTWLNDRQIIGLAPLRDGDTIRFCDFWATFEQPLRELTEADWLSSSSPQALLRWLRDRAVSRRGPWLVAAACYRRLGQVDAAESAEQNAGVAAARGDSAAAWEAAMESAREAVELASRLLDWPQAGRIQDRPRHRPDEERWAAFDVESAEVCRLVRCVFGNPFRAKPAVPAAWLRWNDGTVPGLAKAIYDRGSWWDLPLLGDALLDAGCDDEAMLSHARERGAVHARGCWLLDLLLKKE